MAKISRNKSRKASESQTFTPTSNQSHLFRSSEPYPEHYKNINNTSRNVDNLITKTLFSSNFLKILLSINLKFYGRLKFAQYVSPEELLVVSSAHYYIHPPSATDTPMLEYLYNCLSAIEARYHGCGIILLGDFNNSLFKKCSRQQLQTKTNC